MEDWTTILERDGPAVWRTAFRILGNQADADDCLQEAFLAALDVSRRTVVRHWRALLQRLATARAVDRLRERVRRRPEPVADWGLIGGPAADPSRFAEADELADGLRSALARLSARQAEVFCLYALEEWNYREIAAHTGLSVVAVGVLLHRARQNLRGLMADHLDTPDRPQPRAAAKETR